jgi:histidinol dehydrogenase
MNSNRWNILEYSLKNLVIKKVKNINEAIEESNKIAPEHLILNVLNTEKYLDKITNAGSVFIGSNTPESLGDYLSGTNHVLPTSGFAKAFSGLSVSSFGKFITFQMASQDGLKNVSKNIQTMAIAEGLEFHAKSVNRFDI